jgi:MFS family permease
MCASLNNGVMTLLVEPVKRDLALTDLEISYLLGLSVMLFHVLIGIPAAGLVDRYNRKWLMMVSIGVWSAATAACGLAQTFWQFFASRVGIGTGESINGPLSYSLLADYFPPDKLHRAITIYNVGLQGGTALSLLLGAFLIHILAGLPTIHVPLLGNVRDWQLVFVVTGLIGVPLALLVTTLVEPARRHSAAGTEAAPRGPTLIDVLKYLFAKRRVYAPIFVGLCLTSLHLFGLAAWNAAFYSRTYGWKPATVGLYAGLVNLGLALPALAGAVWCNEFFRKRGHLDADMRVLALGFTSAAPFMILAPLMPSPWLALTLSGIGSAFMLLAAPSLNSAMQIVTPNEMRGRVTALYMFTMFAVGGSLGPTYFAFLTQHVWGEERLLNYTIATSAAFVFPVASLIYWAGVRPYRARVLEMQAAGAAAC